MGGGSGSGIFPVRENAPDNSRNLARAEIPSFVPSISDKRMLGEVS